MVARIVGDIVMNERLPRRPMSMLKKLNAVPEKGIAEESFIHYSALLFIHLTILKKSIFI